MRFAGSLVSDAVATVLIAASSALGPAYVLRTANGLGLGEMGFGLGWLLAFLASGTFVAARWVRHPFSVGIVACALVAGCGGAYLLGSMVRGGLETFELWIATAFVAVAALAATVAALTGAVWGVLVGRRKPLMAGCILLLVSAVLVLFLGTMVLYGGPFVAPLVLGSCIAGIVGGIRGLAVPEKLGGSMVTRPPG